MSIGYIFDPIYKFTNLFMVVWAVYRLCRSWLMQEAYAVAMFPGRPYRARYEPAATVGANVLQYVAYAIRTESALVAADASGR